MKKTLLIVLLGAGSYAMEHNLAENQLDDHVTTTLDLSHSQIDELDYVPFADQLIKLDLRTNNLKRLPKTVSEFQNLRILYLDNNRLSSIPLEVSQLKNLVVLRLDNNQLSELPPLQKLNKLESLSLAHNKLCRITDEHGTIVLPASVGHVNLTHNMITSLPAEIKSLTQLLKLNLAHNRITNLPQEITDCTTLKELALDHNELTNLPQNITQLNQLKSIRINENAKSFIPTIARNEKLATWLLAPLTREFLFTINQMNPGY